MKKTMLLCFRRELKVCINFVQKRRAEKTHSKALPLTSMAACVAPVGFVLDGIAQCGAALRAGGGW